MGGNLPRSNASLGPQTSRFHFCGESGFWAGGGGSAPPKLQENPCHIIRLTGCHGTMPLPTSCSLLCAAPCPLQKLLNARPPQHRPRDVVGAERLTLPDSKSRRRAHNTPPYGTRSFAPGLLLVSLHNQSTVCGNAGWMPLLHAFLYRPSSSKPKWRHVLQLCQSCVNAVCTRHWGNSCADSGKGLY